MIVEAQCVRTRWGVYRAEKLIGAKNLGFPAIQLCVPVGIIAVEQDDVPGPGKMGRHCHPIGLAFADFNPTCGTRALDGGRGAGVCGQDHVLQGIECR